MLKLFFNNIKLKKAVFGLILLSFFAAGLYLQKTFLPKQTGVVQTNLNAPARYAFVNNKYSADLAVIDLYELAAIKRIPLLIKADSLSISRLGAYIAYATKASRKIELLNLVDLTSESLLLNYPVDYLSVHYGGKWLSYFTGDAVVIIDRKGQQEKIVPTNGRVSMTYSTDGSKLFISELDTGHIYQYQLASKKLTEIVSLNAILSPISLMPNGRCLFFNARLNDSDTGLYRYDLISQKLDSIELPVSLKRPYVTNDSRDLLALVDSDNRQSAQLIQLNSETLEIKNSYEMKGFSLKKIREQSLIFTGWLDQVAVILTDKGLYSFELGNPYSGRYHLTQGQPISALVSSDSKTLVMGMEASKKLWLFDMSQRDFQSPLSLDIHPNNILMGETNTLCH